MRARPQQSGDQLASTVVPGPRRKPRWRRVSRSGLVLIATSLVAMTMSSCSVWDVQNYLNTVGYGANADYRCEQAIANGATPSWFFGEVIGVNNAGGLGGWNNDWDLYSLDIIACQESGWNDHAQNGQYLGRWQLNMADIAAAGVSWNCYWNGCNGWNDGQWQDWAANNYIWNRYANNGPRAGDAPVNALAFHNRNNWY